MMGLIHNHVNTSTETRYDPADPKSIELFAQGLVHKSLRDVGCTYFTKPGSNKGTLGLLLESEYFNINPGNSSKPDFVEAGVELKSFPVRMSKKKLVAKERISLGMIDYNSIVNETWETSSFLSKNQLLLLMAYLHENDKTILDFVFQFASLWDFPDDDMKIIKDDWEKIAGKVKNGLAHELSEGDTLYLGAVTKSQTGENRRSQPFGPEAKPRALSLKQSYMTMIVKQILGQIADQEKAVKEDCGAEETFEDYIQRKFAPYIGMKIEDINKAFGTKFNPSAKSSAADISRKILGVKKGHIEEFEKAGVVAKTIRLMSNGAPKESMSFPAFDFRELADERWEESTFRNTLTQRFFFVVFQFNEAGELRLKKVMFWSMPMSKLERDVRMVWDRTVAAIKKGDMTALPKQSENAVSHVRPHGQDKYDTNQLPNGNMFTKQCFWLNRKFIKSQVE